MARGTTKSEATLRREARDRKAQEQECLDRGGPVMDAGIPGAPPSGRLPVNIGEIIEQQQAAAAKREAEELARFERMVSSQERMAEGLFALVAELHIINQSRGVVEQHAPPPLTVTGPDYTGARQVKREDGSPAGAPRAAPPVAAPPVAAPPVAAPTTMADAQRAVLKFNAEHGPAVTGPRLASIGVTKLSLIEGDEKAKAAKYAEVVKVLS